MPSSGEHEIMRAARAGDSGAVRSMLADDPGLVDTVGEAGATLLHVAAERDDVGLAEELLERGVDPARRASWGQTAFEWAANMGSRGVAELLLARGAGRHDLWTAAALGATARVREGFEAGSVRLGQGRHPAPGADLAGWPPDSAFLAGDVVSDAFYIAARNGHHETAAFLLEMGADVNASGYFGGTALHWAAVAGRAATVRWLVERGADPQRRDVEFGATAAGWAREGGHDELAELLEAEDGS